MKISDFDLARRRVEIGLSTAWPIIFFIIVTLAALGIRFRLQWVVRDGQTYVFLALIALCITWVWAAMGYLNGYRKEIESVASLLHRLSLRELQTHDEIVRSREEVREYLHAQPQGHAARSILLASVEPKQSTDSDGPVLKFAPEAFTIHARAVLDHIPTWLRVGIEHLPAVFTALGILFTFIGLISGLAGLSDTRTDQLAQELPKLLAGVRLAFESSLAGIFLSFITLIATRGCLAQVSKVCDRVRTYAQRLARDTAPEQALLDMKSGGEQLNNLAEKLLEKAENQNATLGRLATDIVEGLDKALKKSFETHLHEPLKDMSSSLDGFATRQSEQQADAMAKVFGDFNQAFSENLGTQFGQLDSVLKDVIQWHEKTRELYDKTWENLKEHADKQQALTQAQHQVLEDQRALEQKRAEQIRALHDYTENALGKLESFTQSLHAHAESAKDMADKLVEVQKGMNKLADEIIGRHNDIANASNELSLGIKYLFDKFKSSITSSLDAFEDSFVQLPERYAELLKTIRAELEGGLKQTFQQFDKESAAIVSHLSGSYIDMKASVEGLEASLGVLTAQVEKLHQWRPPVQTAAKPESKPGPKSVPEPAQ